MPKRETHTAKDIAELAERLRHTWRNGQVLRSWLRAHAAEIRGLVREKDWSWDNLGRVLTLAGITYQTGTPWTGENLRRNLNRAELPGKREIKLQRQTPPDPEPPAHPPPAPTSRLFHEAGDTAKPAAEFELIRRPVGTDTETSKVTPLPRKPPRPALSEAEIDAIVMGRSARR